MNRRCWIGMGACLWSIAALAGEGPIVSREVLYDEAPFPSCHASTLVETSAGLVAAYFAGEHEKHPQVGIWVQRQIEGRWTPPVEVANGRQPDGPQLPCWNPVLFQPSGGALHLFYKVGPDPRSWWGMLLTSEDQGKTWSVPRRLPDGILGPIKNKPLELSDGSWLSPTSTETATAWRVHFERSADQGKTWTLHVPSAVAAGEIEPNAIQPSVLILGDGRLAAVGRTRERRLFSTESRDGGSTWSPLRLLEHPNPNSGTDAVTLRDGRHLLISNPVEQGRSPLIVSSSRDGAAWQPVATLEDEPRAEFSYPAVIQTSDGLVHVSYTWKRRRVAHVVLDPSKFKPR